MLTPEGYRRLTRALSAAADELCGGKIAMFHEGGYSPQHAPYCALAIIEEMSATDGGARAIFADGDLVGGQDIRPISARECEKSGINSDCERAAVARAARGRRIRHYEKTIVRRSVCAAFFCALLVAVSPARAQSTIVAFGDSLTAGYGLPAAQSYPALLERALIERGHDVKIINAGVSGDTSADARNRARFTLKTKPQIVIVAFGGNDALRGLPPKAMRENLDFVLQAARDAGAAPVLRRNARAG